MGERRRGRHPRSFGLYQRLLFPAAEFGTDHVIPARNAGPFAGLEPATAAGWTAFLARTPYSDAARGRDPARPDGGRGLPRQRARRAAHAGSRSASYLTSITYKQYLVNHAGVNDEAFFGEYWRGSGGLLGAGGQAVSAADCWILGRPGFPDGVGLGDTEDIQLPGSGARRTRTRARTAARRARGRTATRRCCGSRSAS